MIGGLRDKACLLINIALPYQDIWTSLKNVAFPVLTPLSSHCKLLGPLVSSLGCLLHHIGALQLWRSQQAALKPIGFWVTSKEMHLQL